MDEKGSVWDKKDIIGERVVRNVYIFARHEMVYVYNDKREG